MIGLCFCFTMREDAAGIESAELLESLEHLIPRRTDLFSLKRMMRPKISVLPMLGNLAIRRRRCYSSHLGPL